VDDWQTAVPRDDLMTAVHRLTYEFRTHTGRLYLPTHCCPDMAGCLRLFMALEPVCVRIETIAGTELDTVYVRGPLGWQACR
jgi:hypothetical protein